MMKCSYLCIRNVHYSVEPDLCALIYHLMYTFYTLHWCHNTQNVHINDTIQQTWTCVLYNDHLMYTFLHMHMALADLGGRAWHTPPLWDPILSFLHTFSPKSAHVGGARPPQWVHAP